MPENVNAEKKLIMPDQHVTYYAIGASLGISSTNIYRIFHDNFIMFVLIVVNKCKYTGTALKLHNIETGEKCMCMSLVFHDEANPTKVVRGLR